jgi:outer membrane protein assembly factor BamB
MSLSRYILTALLTALVSIPVAAADWTQFRGPGGLGVSTEKGLPTNWSGSENIVWKTDLPGAGTSSPIFVGDKIFLTCYSGYNEPGQRGGSQEDLKRQVVCLNRQTGKLVWAKEIPSKLPEQERIRDDHGYASNTPVSDGKTVFAFFGKSGVFAFDLTGKQLWHADVGDELNGWGSAASPVV